MTEELFQYVWNYKRFRTHNLYSTDGRKIEVLDFGIWNHDAGPDFLMAKIKIDDLVFVGDVELHLKSSDWFLHKHEDNPNYQNLILHVVYQHDCEIPELIQNHIPSLELREYIDFDFLEKHEVLKQSFRFIPCERLFDINKIPILFEDESVLKKLDALSERFQTIFQEQQNNYEALLFQRLAYCFGLKINADIFEQIAESIDFAVVQKIRQYPIQLEALFFGMAGFLDKTADEHMAVWRREFDFLSNKFKLRETTIRPKFSKLRPFNFPTIRLSQFAMLYHRQPHLFSKIINATTVQELFDLLIDICASEYWNHHYSFGKVAKTDYPKSLSKDFMILIIINAFLPIRYFYYKNIRPEISDEILGFYKSLKAEHNSIIEQWEKLGLCFHNALQSQAFLYHYKTYCNEKKCLNCGIGYQLLKR